jgi:hypothetical protein
MKKLKSLGITVLAVLTAFTMLAACSFGSTPADTSGDTTPTEDTTDGGNGGGTADTRTEFEKAFSAENTSNFTATWTVLQIPEDSSGNPYSALCYVDGDKASMDLGELPPKYCYIEKAEMGYDFFYNENSGGDPNNTDYRIIHLETTNEFFYGMFVEIFSLASFVESDFTKAGEFYVLNDDAKQKEIYPLVTLSETFEVTLESLSLKLKIINNKIVEISDYSSELDIAGGTFTFSDIGSTVIPEIPDWVTALKAENA